MTARAHTMTATAWAALGGDPAALNVLRFVGEGELSSAFAVTDLAAAAVAAAALSVADLAQCRRGALSGVTVDRRLASLWYGWSIRSIGWTIPPALDPIMGDYRARDGWIRLHTNAPHHRAAAERVLGYCGGRDEVARLVSRWGKRELEAAVVESGGCAAEMRPVSEWGDHPQGHAVGAEPLIYHRFIAPSSHPGWTITTTRPLAGIRVLDLTRIVAGPTASRFLAGFGAEVLRIDPPDWHEPGVEPDVTLGKRCARLDLHSADGRRKFESLLAQADVFLHGYRPDALARLGYGAAERRALSPGLVDVCLNAYGWSGPWANRRGFDSLLQMSSGIADAGMRWKNADKPVPLPVQALDHVTGYLMAAAAIQGLKRRFEHGQGSETRLSLARTAKLLIDAGQAEPGQPFAPENSGDLSPAIEATQWGPARRLLPPVILEGAPMNWSRAASALGSASPEW